MITTPRSDSYRIGKGLKKMMMIGLLALLVPVGQALADDPDPGDLGDPDGTAVPIDGGLSLLLAAGAGIGARKLYLQKKKSKEQAN